MLRYFKLFFIQIFFLLVIFRAGAQVVIPFSFWQSNSVLGINSTLVYLKTGTLYTFTATGGNGTYSWAITSAAATDFATITTPGTTSDYTSRLTSYTSDTVTLTSGPSNITAAVYTYDPLSIAPTTLTIGVNGTSTFTGAGGCLNGTGCVGGARVFSVVSGGGTINPATGLFTAPGTAGTTIVQVADSIGNTVTATITVVSGLSISPTSLKLPVFSTNTFTAILGSTPYTYSVFAGTGTIVAATGVYTAPSAAGTATVRVTDNISGIADSAVTIIEPVDVKVGQYFACALYSEGSVKCWGTNGSGQLGIGSSSTIGDVTTEVGGANVFVSLGTGRTAVEIAVGLTHACARLDNATMKCWGQNTYGQLGQGNTTAYGSASGQMGDSLPAINLGTGRTATAIYAFGSVSCAKLDNGTVKCWGRNTNGQLGLGDTSNRGVSAGQMGDSLLAISLGTGRTATKLSGGLDFTCALLDNAGVKCWGNNNHGQAGKDNAITYGDNPNEMGDFLTEVNVGTGRSSLDIVSGYASTCVKRDDNTSICWGRNTDGQCGTGASNGQSQDIGDGSGEVVGTLAAINFAAGFGTLSTLYALGTSTCAMDTANVVKCWGRNAEGELLYGNITQRDAPINTVVNFGTGLVPSKISSGYYTTCALFTNKRIKCWGRATNAGGVSNGVFLNGAGTTNLGTGVGSIGDSLPYVNH